MQAHINAHEGLWLDTHEPLTSSQHHALVQAGLGVRVISSWQELPPTRPGQWLAARIANDADLQALSVWLQGDGKETRVICRIDRHLMKLVVAAMRCGAWSVMSSDDMSPVSWREALHAGDMPEAAPTETVRETSTAAAPTHELNTAPAPSMAAATAPRSAVYVDPTSRHLLALAQRVGQAGVTVLIEGPTGAGKEVLARVLHESSTRARGPFVSLNCAALPEQLIDDMLFGHEKGAFTGAQKEHRGLFEQAHGGTLFLDEIGEMPIHLQAKLLRVLQERQLTRLGSERKVELDVRIVAATNKDLRVAMQQREFREDLYFRISTFKLHIPALRDRTGDILPLVACMLAQHSPTPPAYSVSLQAQQMLLQHNWPGNVRELENVVHRAIVLCPDRQIRPEHLMFDRMEDTASEWLAAPTNQGPAVHAPAAPAPAVQAPTAPRYAERHDDAAMVMNWANTSHTASSVPIEMQAAGLFEAVKSNEHQLIMAAIEATDSRMEAARKLGISPRTLRYKLAKLKTAPQAMTGT
jgi:two-component system response regulator FlrC